MAAVLAGALAMAVLVAAAPEAQAADAFGTVMALDNGELVIDLSASKGATVGALVELWRPLKLKHPVTAKVITDRFRIGTLRVTQAGENLSLATPAEQLHRPAQAGDLVILRGAVLPPTVRVVPGPQPQQPAGTAPAPAHTAAAPEGAEQPEGAEGSETAGEAKVLTQMFDRLRGADLVTRIRAYEDYVRARPQGRFSRVLYEEAQSLRSLLQGPASPQRSAEREPEPEVANFEGPKQALAQTPLQLALQLRGPAAGAVLHIRRDGETSFASYPMNATGRGYFSLLLPAVRMQAPAQDYFIEAVKSDGTTVPLVGSARDPSRIEVDALPTPVPPKKHLYTASMWTDYADYNMSGPRNDWAWQTEGWFGMRYGDVGVRALRSGFGVYRGAGGSLQELDQLGLAPRATGLTYGYLEAELGASSFISFIGRGVVGLRDTGTSGGAQLLIRIGNDRKTNLQLGGEVLGGVGLRSITQLEFNGIERVPILLRTEVSNQPAGMEQSNPRPADSDKKPEETSSGTADVGARAIVQVGYRFTQGLTLSVRGSYQGRTINHSGPGAGAGFTYDW